MKRPKDNIEELLQVQKFRDDAVKDGWSINPTYDHESVDSASKLSKDGFVMSILTRTNDLNKYPNVNNLYEVDISIWGSDTLAIDVPDHYDMELIKRICISVINAENMLIKHSDIHSLEGVAKIVYLR